MRDLDALREEARRTARLAANCTDMKLKGDLTAYVLELESRAARMEATVKSTDVPSKKATE